MSLTIVAVIGTDTAAFVRVWNIFTYYYYGMLYLIIEGEIHIPSSSPHAQSQSKPSHLSESKETHASGVAVNVTIILDRYKNKGEK